MEKGKILFFGSDYFAISFFRNGYDQQNAFIEWLQAHFSQGWNTTNSNMAYDVPFEGTSFIFNIQKLEINNQRALQFNIGENPLFVIQWTVGNIRNLSRYNYRIDFYSQFFTLNRLGQFNSPIFLQEFQKNISGLFFSVVRLDICADVDLFRGEIQSGIQYGGKFSRSALNAKGSSCPETVYIGSSSTNKKTICIYDKKLDCAVKGKMRFFPSYQQEDFVTRIELRLRSEYIKKYQVQISDVFCIERLLFFYFSCLRTRDLDFDFLDLFNSWGYQDFSTLSVDLTVRMARDEYVKRWVHTAKKLIASYGCTKNDLTFFLESL